MVPILRPNTRGYIFSGSPKLIRRLARALDENEPRLAAEFRAELEDAEGEDCVSVHIPTYPDPCYREFMSVLDVLDVYYETR